MKSGTDFGREAACSQRRVGSFLETLSAVENRVNFVNFRREDRAQAKELCLIIAEIERLPDTYDVQIAGEKLPAEMVREIFRMVEHEHIEMVIENFKKERREIAFKKSYLRTAIYNSVFELESHYINQVNADWGG